VGRQTRGLLSHQLNQRGMEYIRLEPEGPGTALIDNVILPVDEIDPIRPAGIGPLGGIAEVIEHRRKFDSELAHACARNERALFFIFGAGKDDLVANVTFHLPDVAGMRFEDIDHQKCDLAAVLIVELVEGGSLPPEGRSRVASEDEHNGFLCSKRGQLDLLRFIERRQGEIRSGIAGVESAGAGLGP